MRKKLLAGLLLAAAFVAVSCDDTLNPYGEFKEKYVLNCVIRADTTFQIATVTGSYPPLSTNPYDNTNDPFIKGATIRIWNGDKVEIMRDTVVPRPENSEYKFDYSMYYAKNFRPAPYTEVEIEAVLPNGRKLKAKGITPDPIYFSKANSDTMITTKTTGDVRVLWNAPKKNAAFAAKLGIIYFHHENGQKVRKEAVVPVKYVPYGDKLVPIYPGSFLEPGYVVNMNTYNKTMELISDGDPNKQNYEILACILEVISMDDNLSAYYNATARGGDLYSVKLDETDYSNIDGGYGIFGIYIKNYYVLPMSPEYIQSFGYLPGLKSY